MYFFLGKAANLINEWKTSFCRVGDANKWKVSANQIHK